MSQFQRYIGIDYSGAATADTRLPGLRVYVAERGADPVEVRPLANGPTHWSRRDVARWLVETLRCGPAAAVGIDHGFSFPQRYFERHSAVQDWEQFLAAFHARCSADAEGVSVQDVRGTLLAGDARWRRVCEMRVGAKSVFHFDVPGSVAKSTHAGLPWLRLMREQLEGRAHFWPFDGWDVPAGCSLVAEAYPALYAKAFEPEGRTADQHDAYAIAAWLAQADANGSLQGHLTPPLTQAERAAARIEGWILGAI